MTKLEKDLILAIAIQYQDMRKIEKNLVKAIYGKDTLNDSKISSAMYALCNPVFDYALKLSDDDIKIGNELSELFERGTPKSIISFLKDLEGSNEN